MFLGKQATLRGETEREQI